MQILFIEPYDGGSHKAFRTGLADHSGHEFTHLTLPARFWKWRMRGCAAWFADEIASMKAPCDLILGTDYLNLADLRGMLPEGWRRCPLVLYMHENQLTYPLSPEEEFDFHFGFTNILSALAADRVVFNSRFHHDLFLDSLPAYLGRMPDMALKNVRPRLEEKSSVLPVGLERRLPDAPAAAPRIGGPRADGGSPVILWNHRWEFDKRPEWLVEALIALAGEGLDFRLQLLGEPRQREVHFQALRETLGERILGFGYAAGREDYDRILEDADFVVSCAAQEYFGISVAEAIQAGCHAVLPREQVYPSLYGSLCEESHFYDGPEGLRDLLRVLLSNGNAEHVCPLPRHCDDYCWERLAPRYDAFFEEVIRDHATTP